jgi:hypothetical protein
MKDLRDIRRTPSIYLNNWSSKEDMVCDFAEGKTEVMNLAQELMDAHIILATYGHESYEGYAFVLYEKDGEFYEVNGSHCSCYGLEGQWSPEETTLADIAHRIVNGRLGHDDYGSQQFSVELANAIGLLED